MNSASANESNLQTVLGVLVDFTGCKLVSTGAEDAALLKTKNAELAQAAPLVSAAIVASHEELPFIFCVWDCLLSTTIRRTRLFRTRAEAEEWLAVDVLDVVTIPPR